MSLSWRDRQKTFFTIKKIEFDQDQRIIDWLDTNKKTFVFGSDYFNSRIIVVDDIKLAEQALVTINTLTNIIDIEELCKNILNVPRICLSINKFLIYTDTFNNVEDNYDTALLNFIQSIFIDRHIDYYYIPNDDGTYFNFASPATQFFITCVESLITK